MEISEHVTLDIDKLAGSSNLGTTQSGQQSSKSSPQALGACIYRVPKAFRKRKEDAYTPQVISISPYHHDNTVLQRMNDYKKRFLDAFLNRSQKSKETFLKFIKGREAKLRNCYFESIAFESDKLVAIVLEDAAFVLEFFYRSYFCYQEDTLASKEYIADLILCDMLLIENQLPFFIVQELLDFADIKAPEEDVYFMQNEKPSLSKLTIVIYSVPNECRVSLYSMKDLESFNVSHFLDFVRICHLPPRNKRNSDPSVSGKKQWTGRFPSATKLREAGVQFRKAESENLFDVNFDSKKGVLEIPFVWLSSTTEVLFRNLVIFEQLHYFNEQHFTDFMKFLDLLVNEPKDVEILQHNLVLENVLADDVAAAAFLNDIIKGTRVGALTSFYFYDICEELCSYYRSPGHKFMANLKQR